MDLQHCATCGAPTEGVYRCATCTAAAESTVWDDDEQALIAEARRMPTPLPWRFDAVGGILSYLDYRRKLAARRSTLLDVARGWSLSRPGQRR